MFGPRNEAQMTKQTQLRNRLPPNDFVQANRSQPPQCPQKHRSYYSRRQTALALQRPSTWAHGRDSDRCAGGREDYQTFEAAIIADYDAQSAVERELVLRLASLLWRMRRATTIETGLFDIHADHLRGSTQARRVSSASRDVVYAPFGWAGSIASRHRTPQTQKRPCRVRS